MVRLPVRRHCRSDRPGKRAGEIRPGARAFGACFRLLDPSRFRSPGLLSGRPAAGRNALWRGASEAANGLPTSGGPSSERRFQRFATVTPFGRRFPPGRRLWFEDAYQPDDMFVRAHRASSSGGKAASWRLLSPCWTLAVSAGVNRLVGWVLSGHREVQVNVTE